MSKNFGGRDTGKFVDYRLDYNRETQTREFDFENPMESKSFSKSNKSPSNQFESYEPDYLLKQRERVTRPTRPSHESQPSLSDIMMEDTLNLNTFYSRFTDDQNHFNDFCNFAKNKNDFPKSATDLRDCPDTYSPEEISYRGNFEQFDQELPNESIYFEVNKFLEEEQDKRFQDMGLETEINRIQKNSERLSRNSSTY